MSRGPLRHGWDLSVKEAIALQKEVAAAVERRDRISEVRTIGGVDVAYGRRGRTADARAAAGLFVAATLEVLDRTTVETATDFPYVPGLLTFREAPAAIAAIEALRIRPDLLLCDGQGLAHPRRCGLASHLGLALDLPSIGAAKSRLTGSHEEPGGERGDWTPLLDGGEVIGACVRTRTGAADPRLDRPPRHAGDGDSLRSALRDPLSLARADAPGRPAFENARLKKRKTPPGQAFCSPNAHYSSMGRISGHFCILCLRFVALQHISGLMMMRCIRTLAAAELPKYREHLLRLDAEDRRLRFGFIIDDAGIREHVRQLGPRTDRIIAQIDDDLRVVGAAHIAPADDGAVEFAISVDHSWRGRGLGAELFDEAVLRARNRGMRRAYIYSLVDNQAMRHLARKAGMAIHSEAGESEACLALPPPTPLSLLREVASERWGMYDYSVKANRRARRPLVASPAV